MHVVRYSDCRRMPWKNGGGETAEIAVSPSGAGLEDFDWRVSMAKVAADGPFSVFADVDRTLAITSGAGMRLVIAGRPDIELSPASAPYGFPADLSTSATLVGGPIADLNVMTRRGRASHRVRREALSSSTELRAASPTTLIVCVSGRIRVTAGSSVAVLEARDTAVIDAADGAALLAPERLASSLIIEIGGA